MAKDKVPFSQQNPRGKYGEKRAVLWLAGVNFEYPDTKGGVIDAVTIDTRRINRTGNVAEWTGNDGYNENEDYTAAYYGTRHLERHEVKTDYRAYARAINHRTGIPQDPTRRICIEVEDGCIKNPAWLEQLAKMGSAYHVPEKYGYFYTFSGKFDRITSTGAAVVSDSVIANWYDYLLPIRDTDANGERIEYDAYTDPEMVDKADREKDIQNKLHDTRSNARAARITDDELRQFMDRYGADMENQPRIIINDMPPEYFLCIKRDLMEHILSNVMGIELIQDAPRVKGHWCVLVDIEKIKQCAMSDNALQNSLIRVQTLNYTAADGTELQELTGKEEVYIPARMAKAVTLEGDTYTYQGEAAARLLSRAGIDSAAFQNVHVTLTEIKDNTEVYPKGWTEYVARMIKACKVFETE